MLDHVPAWLGERLRGLRAGADKIVLASLGLAGDARLRLTSPAFADGTPMPSRFTADGEGKSPPLAWADVPGGTAGFALIVEDPDAPTHEPIVHAILWGIDPAERALAEGAIRDGGQREIGRNTYLRKAWLPPDPPTGHGPHHYAFQLFALRDVPVLDHAPGRSAFVEALRGRVLGAGLLHGLYERR